ncbi:YhcN/YlaJ family sporulation lipoprotein [Jeotgalibacillus campisalis]|nr:YhcN/YlaJ family sporulation lipoprotein [Jeotgalibacillus campisalis]
MKKYAGLLLMTFMISGCYADYKGVDPHQQPPVLSRENDRFDQNEDRDIAELDGLWVQNSGARDEIHQGEISDHLAELVKKIEGVDYVKVIVHDNEIAAAVTHSNEQDVEEEVYNVVREQVGDEFHIYVSQDKATYRAAQGLDRGLRIGYDEKWEHENMENLKGLMTKMS